MAEISLVAVPRARPGSALARRLRTAGSIPAIVYGHGVSPIAVAVDARELRSALSTEQGANALFDLDIDGTHQLAIARELQRHPVRQSISHVDFQVVSRDEIVPADVPVNVIGEALAVHRGGGSIEHLVVTVRVHAKPADIPVAFEIDVSALEIGSSLRISDLAIPAGVTLDGDPETAIVVAHAPRAVSLEGPAEGEVTEAGGTPGAPPAAESGEGAGASS